MSIDLGFVGLEGLPRVGLEPGIERNRLCEPNSWVRRFIFANRFAAAIGATKTGGLRGAR